MGANHHVAPFPGEDFQMFERDLPGENKGGHSRDAVVGALPLETCDTLNGSWGYNAGDQNFKTVKQCVHYLVRAAGRNANLLLNIGPRPDGTIDPESAKRLEGIGEWLAKYEATVRPTRGGPVPPQAWGASTATPDGRLPARARQLDGRRRRLADAHRHGETSGEAADVRRRGRRRSSGAATTTGQIQIKREWDREAIDEVFRIAK